MDPKAPGFRRAAAPDAPGLHRLVCAAYEVWVPVIGRQPMPMLADYAEALRCNEVLLYEDGPTLAGMIEMRVEQGYLWVQSLAVHPAFQGRGLGRALLQRAGQRARAAGLAEMRLLTNEAFASNLAFYTRLGFCITGREPYREGFTLYLSCAV